jgi:hypothetical protein
MLTPMNEIVPEVLMEEFSLSKDAPLFFDSDSSV